MKTNTKFLLILMLGFLSFQANAQYDLTLYNLGKYTPQGHQFNPASFPEVNSYLILPINIQVHAANGFSLDDFYEKQDQGKLKGSLNYLLSNIDGDSYLNQGLEYKLFEYGIRIKKKHFFSIGLGVKVQNHINLPRGFIEFIAQGNTKENGETIDHSIENLYINSISYGEITASYGTEINEQLHVGARVKYLWGLTNVKGEFDSRIITNDDFSVNVETGSDSKIHTAGLLAVTNHDDSYYSEIQDYLLEGGNTGFAFDLGATYQLNEKIHFSASILDLGYISWKDDLRTYQLPQDIGFAGTDIDRLLELKKDYEDGFLDYLTDSLSDKYKVIENEEEYTTVLHGKVYLNGSYDLNQYFTFGSTIVGTTVGGDIHTAVNLYSTLHLGSNFHLNTNFGYQNETFANLGAGFVYTPGPFQMYLATDNLIPTMSPETARAVDFRFGINILFGKNRFNQ